jgi:ketosteroid isomerase-like protein
MTNDEMGEAVRGYFEAVSAADGDRLRALFVDDVRWRVPQGAIEPYCGMHAGAEKIIDMMLGAVGQSFVAGSQQTEILTTLFGANLVCVETQMTARTPDGRDYCNDYTFFFEFRDGRISEIREHVDTRYAANFFS